MCNEQCHVLWPNLMAAVTRTGALTWIYYPCVSDAKFQILFFSYKCLHDKIKIPIENYTQFIDNTSRRSGDCGLFLKPLLRRAETFKESVFHRIISEWNSLPIQIRDSTSVNSFKHQLMLHFKLKLQQSFKVYDLCSWTSTCRCQPCVCNRMKILFLRHFIAIFKYLLTFKP